MSSEKRVLTTCIYCGCGCGFYFKVRDGRINGVYPSREHPVNKGSLCVKGWNAAEFVQHPDRLTEPLIKENGKFRKATWEEALNLVSGKMKEHFERFGSKSLAFFASAKCTNEENYILQKFARAVFKTNNVDHCARL